MAVMSLKAIPEDTIISSSTPASPVLQGPSEHVFGVQLPIDLSKFLYFSVLQFLVLKVRKL